jgi:DNA-binding transcriptional MerR regulator
MSANVPGPHRIGEFARRVGVSPELLRAWEQRYGLLSPVRSAGGYRLYTDADAERVASMRRALDEGLSASDAARMALREPQPSPEHGLLEDAAARLLSAIERYDEDGVHAVIDESLAAFGLEAVIGDLILPTLDEVGDAWERGALDVSQEHFASNLIRGRLLALARLWGRGAGPLALLACAPGEQHDIGLLAFGLALRTHGWRILFLGADTPTDTVQETASSCDPALVVIASFDSALLEAEAAGLRTLARHRPVALSGPGATVELCRRLELRRLDGDVIAAANEVAHSKPSA